MAMSALSPISSASPPGADEKLGSEKRLNVTQSRHRSSLRLDASTVCEGLRREPQQTGVNDNKIGGLKVGRQDRKAYGVAMFRHWVER